jgi:hypothetical protein
MFVQNMYNRLALSFWSTIILILSESRFCQWFILKIHDFYASSGRKHMIKLAVLWSVSGLLIGILLGILLA